MDFLDMLRSGVTEAHVDNAMRASWLTAVHDAMRSVGGRVAAPVEDTGGNLNYYRVAVESRYGVASAIMLNSAARLVAAAEAADPCGSDLAFVDVPGGEIFAERGFQVAGVAEMNTPLGDHHCQALSWMERQAVAYHNAYRIGDVLFSLYYD